MSWYYAVGEERVGPIADTEFSSMVSAGDIKADTLVWRQGMAEWQPFHEVGFEPPVPAVEAAEADTIAGETHPCEVCGRHFSTDDLIKYKEAWICPECKPAYFQRLKEGAEIGKYHFGGFWIRFWATIVDGFIVMIPNVLIGIGFVFVTRGDTSPAPDTGFMLVFQFLFSLGAQIFPLIYEVFFVGKYGATPGKMVCGLKVQRPNGDRITYWRALGRHLAKILSGLILNIGYIIAGFDEEKRALHDMICDTRVVRTRP